MIPGGVGDSTPQLLNTKNRQNQIIWECFEATLRVLGLTFVEGERDKTIVLTMVAAISP